MLGVTNHKELEILADQELASKSTKFDEQDWARAIRLAGHVFNFPENTRIIAHVQQKNLQIIPMGIFHSEGKVYSEHLALNLDSGLTTDHNSSIK